MKLAEVLTTSYFKVSIFKLFNLEDLPRELLRYCFSVAYTEFHHTARAVFYKMKDSTCINSAVAMCKPVTQLLDENGLL